MKPVKLVFALALAPALVLAAGGCDKQKQSTPASENGAGATAEGEAAEPAEGETAEGAEQAGAAEPAEETLTLRPPTEADLATYTEGLGEGPLRARIATNRGTITCELAEEEAPVTVANFVGLARGLHPWRDPKSGEVVKKPFYDGLIFHRVIPQFMIQGGDPLGTGTGGPGYQFQQEISKKLRHDKPGTMSMANAGPGTNGSQFFITEEPVTRLDGGYNVFGYCDNVDVVKAIARVETGANDRPAEDVVIEKVEIFRGDAPAQE